MLWGLFNYLKAKAVLRLTSKVSPFMIDILSVVVDDGYPLIVQSTIADELNFIIG